jgi:hypothetical protein
MGLDIKSKGERDREQEGLKRHVWVLWQMAWSLDCQCWVNSVDNGETNPDLSLKQLCRNHRLVIE